MTRTGRTLLALILTWGLVWAPFGHALAMARMGAAPALAVEAAPMPACHHAAAAVKQASQEKPAPDECRCHKGGKCHCASASLALPASLLPMPTQTIEHRTSALAAFLLHPLPAPEPPPPRS